jgi:cell division septum initiation protein DivIVA
MKKANLMQLLDQLEELAENSPRLPLTGKSLVPTEELYQLADQLRLALPEEVKRAEWVAKEKERLLEESKNEAQKMIQQAKEYIQKLIDESEIVRQAKEQAAQVIESAKQNAQELSQGAAGYAQQILLALDQQLEKTLQTVRRGQEELGKKKHDER